MRRFFADWSGNYIFFCPLVIVLNHMWTAPEVMVSYLVTSLAVAGFGGPAYSWFLKHIWYPVWRTKW